LLLDNVIRPYGLQTMNKSQLIDALAARLGDRRTAASAVDGLLSTIVETVKAGESVSLTGFGVFEARARAARVGRNPRTGQTVAVPAATVPAFRPGTGFKTAVGGGASAPPSAARTRVAAAAVEAPAKPAAKASQAKPAKATKATKATKEAKEAKAAKAGAAKTAGAKTAAPKTATAKASAKEAKAPAAKKGKKDTKADAKAAPARKKAKK
jgi:DNA-binding protein HU-beta